MREARKQQADDCARARTCRCQDWLEIHHHHPPSPAQKLKTTHLHFVSQRSVVCKRGGSNGEAKPTFGVSARPPEQETIRMLAWGDLRSSSMMRMRRGRKRCASIISASASCQLSIFFATLRHRRRWHVRGRHVRGRHIWESLSFTHNSTGLALLNRRALEALEYIEVL